MKISCPKCQAVLTSPRPVPAGVRVKCPKCSAGFAVPDGAGQAAARPREEPAPVLAELAEPPTVEFDDAEEVADEDAPKRPGKRRGPPARRATTSKNMKFIWALVGLVGLLAVVGVAVAGYLIYNQIASGPPRGGAPFVIDWKPDPALTRYLDPETNLPPYTELRLQPPRGYTIHSTSSGPGRFITMSGAPRSDGTRPLLNASVHPGPLAGPAAARELERAFVQLLTTLQTTSDRRYTGWNSMGAEHGDVNGIPFIRARFAATNPQGKRVSGFAYIAFVGSNVVEFACEDIEPYEAEIRLAESAVLTFHKQ
jgi:hypothetical protein